MKVTSDPFATIDLPPDQLPPINKVGNYTNKTVINQSININDKPVVVIKMDHGIDAGYSGLYESSEVNDAETWAFSYTFKTYALISEVITVTIADFYQIKL